MRAENIIGRLRQNLHSKSTREGHQKNAGVKDTFPVQWSGENLGSSLHHKVWKIQMGEQTRFGSPAVSHVRHASLNKPVNKPDSANKGSQNKQKQQEINS